MTTLTILGRVLLLHTLSKVQVLLHIGPEHPSSFLLVIALRQFGSLGFRVLLGGPEGPHCHAAMLEALWAPKKGKKQKIEKRVFTVLLLLYIL